MITTDIFSDRIVGGPGTDVIIGSSDNYPSGGFEFQQALLQKDLITGGTGKDTFALQSFNTYGLNDGNDFGVISDFEASDRISTVYHRGDLLIDGTDGSLKLAASISYLATTVRYTARIYLDSDSSNTVTAADELLMYACGAQPTTANFVYII